MALSYLNLFDADAAWGLANDLAATFGQPAVAIIKHANPCGAAVADTLADAYQRAFECDERSAFGGIVALSHRRRRRHRRAHGRGRPGRRRDRARATADGVIEALAEKRKNTRLLDGHRRRRPTPTRSASSPARWLVQDAHHFAADPRRLAGRHQARSRPRPSGPTPSWRGAWSAG